MTQADLTANIAGRRAAFALVAAASLAALTTIDTGPAVAVGAWIIVGSLCGVAIAWGLHTHRPAPTLAWALTAVGALFWLAAGLTRIWFGGTSTDPAATDLLATAGLIPLILGQIALGRHRAPGHQKNVLIDGSILTLVALLVVWVTIIAPGIEGSLSLDELAVAAFPLLDVLLLMSILWLAFLPGTRSLALGFFAGAFATVFLVDGARYLGHDLSGGYLIALALLSAGFVHPSCRQATAQADPGESDQLHRGRLVLLGMAMFAGPVAAMSVENELTVGNVFITICGLALVALVVVRFVGVVRDSEHSRRRFRVMAESLPVGICEIDTDLRVSYANPEADRLLGVSSSGLPLAELGTQMSPEDRDRVRRALLAVQAGTPRDVVVQIGNGAEGVRWIQLRGAPAGGANGDDVTVLASMLDITELKAAQETLRRQATHDPLTGLPNRRLLGDRTRMALARAKRRSMPVGMLFCDLDGFKEVNDKLGHQAGDRVLVEIARRFSEAVRTGDTVARVGGDEFVVLCEDVGARGDLEQLAHRIVAAINRPIEIDGHAVTVGVSIGIALGDDDSRASGLVRAADSAMYRAKDRGRNRVELADSPRVQPMLSESHGTASRQPTRSGAAQFAEPRGS